MAGGIGTDRLTDRAIKAFMAGAQPGKKLSDGGGLYLFTTPSGGSTWRIKYRIGGVEKTYSVGTYPSVTLAAARTASVAVKEQLRAGKDPVIERRVSRASLAASADTSFRGVADDWLRMKKREWSGVHYFKSLQALERDIFPALGSLPIGDISPAIVAKVIEGIHKRGVLETASRLLQHVNGIFRYAQAKGLCRDNPAGPAREILPRKKDAGRIPALLEFAALGDVLRQAELARLSPSVRMAHRLCAFTAARIGNVVDSEWAELDLDSSLPVWVIPRGKMKVANRGADHRIPLCPEIAAELRQWRDMTGGNGHVFPSPTGKQHLSRESLEKAYRVTLKLGGKHAPHGWRSAISTLARDHGFERDVVELALDHAHDNEVARAYDRGERFEQRIKLFEWWGSRLTEAQRGAAVFPLVRRATT